MKIVVLGGGLSTERQVSLVTSTSVCRALRSVGHRAIFVDMYLGVEEYQGRLEDLFDAVDGLCDNVSVSREVSNLAAVVSSRKLKGVSRIGVNVIELCKLADCVFIGLHGVDGEDGKIQALFDLMGIKYTGSGYIGSAMAMDKSLARLIMMANDIKCAPLTDHVPCVVKCAHGGSSIGTYVCHTDEEFKEALSDADQYQDSVFVEKMIKGVELSVPVLDGEALPPIEIVPPQSGKFDYVAKYQKGEEGATEICPARLTINQIAEVQRIAEKLHKVIGLSVYSRSDFILDSAGEFWCLEVNTLPGMTPSSLFPKAAAKAGISYEELCERIIRLSVDRK